MGPFLLSKRKKPGLTGPIRDRRGPTGQLVPSSRDEAAAVSAAAAADAGCLLRENAEVARVAQAALNFSLIIPHLSSIIYHLSPIISNHDF